MTEQSVSQIVERCQQGDREAFGLLYTAMSDQLHRVCRRYVTDEDTANDLVHDSFILIFSKINSLKDTSKAEAWMQKVAQNLSLMYLQRHHPESVISLDELKEPLAVAAPPTLPITYDEIMNLVDALPNSYQRVFRLSVLEGLSHQEIAALLNIEPHTSSAQLFRAKKLLRQSLTILLLGLLCVSLPLGWHWLKQKQMMEAPSSPETNRPTASAKPTPEQSDSINSERIPTLLRANSHFTPSKLPVQTAQVVTQQMIPADTMVSTPVEIPETDTTKVQDKPLLPAIPTTRHQDKQDWILALAYNGINKEQSFNLPYGEPGMNDPEMDTITHHRMPLTIGLSVDKMLNRRLSIGTGLQYTRLHSETQEGNTYTWVQKVQRLQYLGIPLRLSWHPVNTNRWRLYGTAQTMLELPLHSTLQSNTIVGGQQIKAEEFRLSPSLQWSIGAGVGLEYRLTPVIGIYAEPSIHYFFKTDDGLDTYRTAYPATFSVPFGIRFQW